MLLMGTMAQLAHAWDSHDVRVVQIFNVECDTGDPVLGLRARPH